MFLFDINNKNMIVNEEESNKTILVDSIPFH